MTRRVLYRRDNRSGWVAVALLVTAAGLCDGDDAVRARQPAASTAKPAKQKTAVLFETDVLPVVKRNCLKCHNAKLKKGGLNLSSIAGVMAGSDSGRVVSSGKPGGSLLYEVVSDGSMPPEKKDRLAPADVAIIRRWIEQGSRSKQRVKANTPAITQHRVLPILLLRCTVCHGGRRKEADLDLRSVAGMLKGGKSGPAILPGKPEKSLLLKRIHAGEMPPARKLVSVSIKPIEPQEVQLLETWIRQGARSVPVKVDRSSSASRVSDADRRFWSFRRPKAVAVPRVRNASRVANPIDAFLLRKLEAKGLSYTKKADRATLLRRLTIDLTGLPPSPEDVQRFLDDDNPRAYEARVDRLLASPRYGARWARHWLDIAGYADSEGAQNEDRLRPHIWRYRDYVVRAFNADKPYDRFLQEQLAGDELADYESAKEITDEMYDNLVATGFLRTVPDRTFANITNFVPDRLEVVADAMQIVGSAVLGLTVQCARCHSHKFDPISHRDYYELKAVFQDGYDEHDWLKSQGPRTLPHVTSRERAKYERQVARINAEIKKLKKPRDAAKIKALEQSRPAEPRIRALWSRGTPSPTYLLRRGNYLTPGRLVAPNVPGVLRDAGNPFVIRPPWKGAKQTGRRLAFARWVTHPSHPLTARVMVNRIWMHHFGRGLVNTPDNFGKAGAAPSHPELLDWLAVEFVRHGWSVKHIHRLIVTSSAYRQSSRVAAETQAADPDNILLSRMSLKRMEAEVLRDSLLFAAGELDERPFGPPDGVTRREDGLVTSDRTPRGRRRSIFVRHRRTTIPTLLECFDSPQMGPNCVKRGVSIVSPQALNLLNSKIVYELSKRFADRVIREAGDDRDSQLRRISLIAYGRLPTNEDARPKAVIHLFMNGGPSQMDLFDPKPKLTQLHGKSYFEKIAGEVEFPQAAGALMGSPFAFQKRGESGMDVSEALPHLARCVDDITLIRSVHTTNLTHEPALYMFHSGSEFLGHPTLGAWVTYALGSENRNLPAYVVLDDPLGLPVNGIDNWQAGYLPQAFQGTRFRATGSPVLNLKKEFDEPDAITTLERDLIGRLDRRHKARRPFAPSLDARIASYQLAARMQLSATDALDLSQETAATQRAYGIGNKITDSYGRRCLIARRLIERGVRFVQLFINGQIWDNHSNIGTALKSACDRTDQPAAALLNDLKQRGLLDETLVVWGGEMGRLPISQLPADRDARKAGRDHNKNALCMWMAGGGVKRGYIHGATDELGFAAVEKKVHVSDFHATLLHLLGFNHEELFVMHNGLKRRLTGVAHAKAVDLGIERCREHGVSVVALRNSGHLGRIGHWSEMAGKAGLISLHFVNTSGLGMFVVPAGGLEPRLSVNPVSIGFPVAGADPVVLDIAAAATAEGKLKVARNSKIPVPDGWIVDAEGNPTTDANDFYGPPRGAILPLGGHKGSGLGFMVELLAGALTGSGCSKPGKMRLEQGMLGIYIDPAKLQAAESLFPEVVRYVEFVKSARPADPAKPVLVPGEVELQNRKQRSESGIELDETTWAQLVETASRCGVAGDVVDAAKMNRVPDEIALDEAVGVATDSADRVFVFHRGEPPVLVFEADGTFITGWGAGQFVRPHGIWIGDDDTLFLVDDQGHSVRQYTLDGDLLRTIGPSGQPSETGIQNGDLRTITGGPPFNEPTNLVRSSTGEFYITDGYGNARLHRFSPEGELIASWGAPGQGDGEFFLPHGLGIDAADRLYVADRENNRIQIFSPEGEFLDQWTDVVRPCEAFVASDGLVYVAEVGMRVGMFPWMTRDLSQSGGRVSVYDQTGLLLTRWGGGDDPASPADFYAPHDIWVDSRGDVYVAEVKVAAAVSVGDDTSQLPTLRKFVIHKIRRIERRLPVIFITAGDDSAIAIEAMQIGAFDYVTKPLDLPALNELVELALKTRRLMNVPVAIPTGDVAAATPGDLFLGRSPEMIDVFKAIGRVAGQEVNVLILGESGTGKELVARSIYQHSSRAEECFMAVNCAALPDTLLESELFGHEKGAFTGADQRRIGKFEQCDGGTIFLDEVGDMSPLVQGKVLRLLQQQQFERVGGNTTISTNVRIISATNRNLSKMIDAGEFRADLYYRLNGVTISLPPLRERETDIPLLLEHFLTHLAHEMKKADIDGISPDALELLLKYDWPGNIRELQSVVRQSLLNATGTVISAECLPDEISGETSSDSSSEAGPDGLPPIGLARFIDERLKAGTSNLYAETLEMMERFLMTRVLRETNGNQTQTAEILGITRGKVRDRIATFGISLDKSVSLDGEEAE
eukprot:g10268.t1